MKLVIAKRQLYIIALWKAKENRKESVDIFPPGLPCLDKGAIFYRCFKYLTSEKTHSRIDARLLWLSPKYPEQQRACPFP
jgi:hypothetical protein